MIKECLHCGSSFEAKTVRKKWCSNKCASSAEYYRNRERVLTYMSTPQYRERNNERIRLDRKNNPEKYRKIGRKRRAQERSDPERWEKRLKLAREWLAKDRLKNPEKHDVYTLRNSRNRASKTASAETLYRLEFENVSKE